MKMMHACMYTPPPHPPTHSNTDASTPPHACMHSYTQTTHAQAYIHVLHTFIHTHARTHACTHTSMHCLIQKWWPMCSQFWEQQMYIRRSNTRWLMLLWNTCHIKRCNWNSLETGTRLSRGRSKWANKHRAQQDSIKCLSGFCRLLILQLILSMTKPLLILCKSLWHLQLVQNAAVRTPRSL